MSEWAIACIPTSTSLCQSRLLAIPVRVLLDNVRSLYNVGSFFRTCDAVGVERMHLCGITGRPPGKAISKTALGAEERVPWDHHWNAVEVLTRARMEGLRIAAIETREDAIPLFDWAPAAPVCLVFGNEVDGVRPPLLALADECVRIPMLGTKRSLNVATAGGVVLYEALRKLGGLTRGT